MDYQATQQMLEVVRRARERARRAEGEYDAGAMRLQRKASSTIDLFGGTATSQVVDIASDARRICDALYAAYQTLVRVVDEECRPLLAQEPDMDAVCEVRDLIRWLNDESEIENNFTASFNYRDLGQVASAKYVPTMENKMIQSYWEEKYDRWPGRAEAEAEKRRRQEELRRAQQAEREARYKVEQERYEQELAAWEQANAEVQRKRKAEVDTLFAQEKERMERETEENYRSGLAANKTRLQNLQQQKAAAETELSTLGFFQFGRKNQVRRDIERFGILISKAEAETFEVENRHAREQSTLSARLEDRRLELQREAEKCYPAPRKPGSPVKPSSAPMTAVQVANSGIKEALYETIQEHGELMTLTQIMEACPEAADLSNQRVSALVRQLVNEGRVERVEMERKAFFRVAEEAPTPSRSAPSYTDRASMQERYEQALHAPTSVQLANEAVKEAILRYLREQGRPCLITEIMTGCPEAADLTNQRVSALIRQLVIEDRVERTEMARKAYFTAVE